MRAEYASNAQVTSVRRQLRLLRYAKPQWPSILLLSGTMVADIALELARPWPLALARVLRRLGYGLLPVAIRTATEPARIAAADA